MAQPTHTDHKEEQASLPAEAAVAGVQIRRRTRPPTRNKKSLSLIMALTPGQPTPARKNTPAACDTLTEKGPGLHGLQAPNVQRGKQPHQRNTASQLLAATDTAWTATLHCCTEPAPLHQKTRQQPCCQLPILPGLLCRSRGRWTAGQMISGQEAGGRQKMAVVSAAARSRPSWAELAEL